MSCYLKGRVINGPSFSNISILYLKELPFNHNSLPSEIAYFFGNQKGIIYKRVGKIIGFKGSRGQGFE